MNTTFSQDLSTRAMLAGLSISAWSAKRFDKKVSAEVAHAHGTSEDVGRYNKKLVADDEFLNEIRTQASAARDYYYYNTLAWDDDGHRILNASLYYDYMAKMEQFQNAFNAAADKFCDYSHWTEVVERAKGKLNGLFNPEDYPRHQEIRRKFDLRVKISPLPASQDFRVALDAVAVQQIQEAHEKAVEETIFRSMKDVYERIHHTVEDMANRLGSMEITPEGKTLHAFRDSVTGNLQELLDVLPHLNIINDPSLNALGDSLRATLLQHSAQSLRDNHIVRKNTAERAAEIAQKMAAFVGQMAA